MGNNTRLTRCRKNLHLYNVPRKIGVRIFPQLFHRRPSADGKFKKLHLFDEVSFTLSSARITES